LPQPDLTIIVKNMRNIFLKGSSTMIGLKAELQQKTAAPAWRGGLSMRS